MAERFSFVFQLHPGAMDEYVRRHEQIWPELLDALEAAGIHDYSIHAYGDLLIGTLKCRTSWSDASAVLSRSPAQQDWNRYMADLIAWQLDERGELRRLQEVFRFEGRGAGA